MTAFLQTTFEGELEVDHRASPGLTEEQARALGYDKAHLPFLREGKVCRTPTMGCCHCGGVVVLNPQRTRHRNHCPKCNRYICDWCHAATTDPDYIHRNIEQIREMIQSGKWRFAGGSMSNPMLIPMGECNG